MEEKRTEDEARKSSLPSHKLGDLIKPPSKEKAKESYNKWKAELKVKANNDYDKVYCIWYMSKSHQCRY